MRRPKCQWLKRAKYLPNTDFAGYWQQRPRVNATRNWVSGSDFYSWQTVLHKLCKNLYQHFEATSSRRKKLTETVERSSRSIKISCRRFDNPWNLWWRYHWVVWLDYRRILVCQRSGTQAGYNWRSMQDDVQPQTVWWANGLNKGRGYTSIVSRPAFRQNV